MARAMGFTSQEPRVARFRPDPEWKAAGHTPDGKQLYRWLRKRHRAVPLLDEDGNQIFKRHPSSGEPVVAVNKPEPYEEDLLFYIDDDGQWNKNMVFYQPPTAEQLAEEERKRRQQRGMERLMEALGAADVDPGELIDEIMARKAAPEAEPEEQYPVMYGPGLWRLSDGSTMRGKKDEAEDAEARLHADI